eukprot:15477378-Alexandrium_andersonii.AAC.1
MPQSSSGTLLGTLNSPDATNTGHDGQSDTVNKGRARTDLRSSSLQLDEDKLSWVGRHTDWGIIWS